MAMEEQSAQEQQNQRYQYQQGQTAPGPAQAEIKKKPDTGDERAGPRYCKYCEEPLAADQVFCPNCGEKHGGEEHECSYCGQVTTKKNCPKCQNLIVPCTCPKCGKKSLKPVCDCGDILDKKLQAAMAAQEKAAEQSVATIRQMSAEEVQKVEALFRAEEENPDLKKFQKRLLEREKLLGERDYYNKMQKEIVEVFGARPFKIEIPDPEEQAARMRIYAGLERTIIEKQRRATQAELEAKFPELRKVHEIENRIAEEKAAAEEADRQRRLEQAKRQKEMEEKYRAILESVEQEIQEAQGKAEAAEEAKKAEEKERLLRQKAEEEALLKREREEAEKKAREEAERRARIAAEEKAAAERAAAEAAAERQREMQEAREKAQREAYLNRMLGTYYYQGNEEKLTIIIRSPSQAYCEDKFQNRINKVYSEHALTMKGSQITLKETANPENYPLATIFRGNLNDAGTTLSGNWVRNDGQLNNYLIYYKVQ